MIAAVIDVGGVSSPNTADEEGEKVHHPWIDADLDEGGRDHDRDQDIGRRRRQAHAEIAPKMNAIATMATKLTPAASTSSAPSLVGTPVITSAPVMIDRVASSSAMSEIMSI